MSSVNIGLGMMDLEKPELVFTARTLSQYVQVQIDEVFHNIHALTTLLHITHCMTNMYEVHCHVSDEVYTKTSTWNGSHQSFPDNDT